MAHVAKFKASAVGNMTAHYERRAERERGFERDNIDPDRTHLNYNLAASQKLPQAEFIRKRIESLDLARAPRKDAVVMCDCVVTMPRGLDRAKTEEFFKASYNFLEQKFGSRNIISSWVHMDEATPHMHFAWVPVTSDGRLSAKDVVNRKMLSSLHERMEKFVSFSLAEPVSLTLDESERARKKLSKLPHSEFVQVIEKVDGLEDRKDSLEAQCSSLEARCSDQAERLERLRRDGEDAEERIELLERLVAEVRKLKDAGSLAFPRILNRCLRAVEGIGAEVEKAAEVAKRELSSAFGRIERERQWEERRRKEIEEEMRFREAEEIGSWSRPIQPTQTRGRSR